MRHIEFTKKFGNKQKGDKASYDGMLANQLVNVDKVAKYVKNTPKK